MLLSLNHNQICLFFSGSAASIVYLCCHIINLTTHTHTFIVFSFGFLLTCLLPSISPRGTDFCCFSQ
ncbi:hypothetical protein M5689_019573 [Euphorbia peplus]|nr:hypothetical protein M5689_019573 [Euphorbia peplus]